MTDDLGDSLRRAREAKGLSKAELARRLEVSGAAISQWEAGKTEPSPNNLQRTAEVLDIVLSDPPFAEAAARIAEKAGVPVISNPSYEQTVGRGALSAYERELKARYGASDPEIAKAPYAPSYDSLQGFARDVPVYGQAVAGINADFSLNGQEIDRAMRPPGLANTAGIFALYVANDSMYPAWKEGALFYVNPNRRPAIGDDVVVELYGDVDGSPGRAYFKRLIGRNDTQYIVEQYNPPKKIYFEKHEVRQILRVVPWEEALGIS